MLPFPHQAGRRGFAPGDVSWRTYRTSLPRQPWPAEKKRSASVAGTRAALAPEIETWPPTGFPASRCRYQPCRIPRATPDDSWFLRRSFATIGSQNTATQGTGKQSFHLSCMGNFRRGEVQMYVWMFSTFSRVWIHRVRLPILLVVDWTGREFVLPVYVRAREFGLAQCCRETPDSIFENYDYVTRACYLRLLWPRGRSDPLYHSVLHLCAEFGDSGPFLWLNIKNRTSQQFVDRRSAARL